MVVEVPVPTTETGTTLDREDEAEYESTYSLQGFDGDDTLPEQLKVWLDGWPERRNTWNRQSEDSAMKFHREFSCCKHDFDNLVMIAGASG
jgi:hypothetical protein